MLSWRDILLFPTSAGHIFFHPFSMAQSCHFCAPGGLQLHQWDQNEAQGQTGLSWAVKWDLLLFPGSMASEFGLPSCAGSRPARVRISCFEASSFPQGLWESRFHFILSIKRISRRGQMKVWGVSSPISVKNKPGWFGVCASKISSSWISDLFYLSP